MFPDGSAFVILDPEDPFVHSPELQRSEVYVPNAIVDFFEADVFTGECVGDADPVLVPADAAVPTHEPDFEVTGIFERRELPR